jgi:ribose/xylose/arabinose/galactoside ABC-type transport system permease subunit
VVVFALVQLGSAIYGLLRPGAFPYTSTANIQTMLHAVPILGIAALGVGVLMIAGEFDISVGANYLFSSAVMGKLTINGVDPFLAVAAGLAVGAGIGALNGVVTLLLNIPSFIATLGTAGIWSAATLYLSGAGTQLVDAQSSLFESVFSGQMGVVSSEFAWFVVIGAVLWAVLQRHRVGNHIFAVGGDKKAAVTSGVHVARTKVIAFMITGTCAAMAGMLAAIEVGAITPSSGFDIPLQAIAACVVGGLLLTGGRGTILGIILGAALIYWIQDVLLLAGAPGFYLSAFVGALVIGAAAMYEGLRARRR